MTNKFGLFQDLFGIRIDKVGDMADHVSYLESAFLRLQLMVTSLKESLKEGYLMSFFYNFNEFQFVSGLINTLSGSINALDYATTIEVEKEKWISERRKMKPEHLEDNIKLL